MKKSEFKKAYSIYRKNASNASVLGSASFKDAVNSCSLMRRFYLREVAPVSKRCRMALSDAGLREF